uniref:Short transient receptor potential channel 4-associated protein-like n=1 Tax=Saccoglossus kowalevskii TaxID=10224 RepID=A0ABM0MDA2_SACKO|nr:PREDICTED: short transient receptor potential channel 4-associated protein-like [Saccoglossus kowalevskii]
MSTSIGKVVKPKRKVNVMKHIITAQATGRGFSNARMLPDELIKCAEDRIGATTQGYQGIPENIRRLDNMSGNGVGHIVPTPLPASRDSTRGRDPTIPSILKDIGSLLSHEGFQEYPSGTGIQKEIRVINSEVFNLFGGLELVLQILLRPSLFPVNTAKSQSTEFMKSVACTCLDVLHHLCLNMTKIAVQLSERDDLMPYLFTLMGERKCFLSAATLMEDLLGNRQQMVRLDEITNLKGLVDSFDQQQLANFCRVLSIAVSDLDSSEDRMTLVAQDEASRKQTDVPISEINQGILVDLPGFIKRLVEVAGRRLPSPSQNLPALFNELESWVTWLDSSLAFDALMEVAQEEEEVYLTIPLDAGQGDTSILPQSMRVMHEVMYKVEVLYVLCLLLTGKQRNKVHDLLADSRLVPSINDIFDKIIWKCNLRSSPDPELDDSCECSPEIALKIQFLRLVHSFCDHHPNKYLMLTRTEINELNRIANNARVPILDSVKNINRQLLCVGQKGLLTKVVEATKKEPVESPFRFWLGRAIESFLRGATSFADQTFLLRRGLLRYHIIRHMIDNDVKSKEILQSSFDLLGELMKFNVNAFKRFNKLITSETDFANFISLIKDNIVDSNMFIRCMILSLEHFETEQTEHKEYATTKCKLLGFILERKARLQFLFKLINVIKVQSLTQENVSCLNTTLVFLMFAKQKGELQSSCISFDIWKKTVEELLEDDPNNDLTVSHYLTKNCITYK